MIWFLVGLAAVTYDTHAFDPEVWCSNPANARGGYCLDYFNRNETEVDSGGTTLPPSTTIRDSAEIPTTATTTAPRPIATPTTNSSVISPARVPHDNFVRLAL